MKIDEEHKEIYKEKPAPMTKQQKQVLTLMFIVIAVFIVCGAGGFSVITNILDVGWVYMLAGCVCVALKLADQRTVISKHIPWGIVLLVSGFTILLTILTENGGADLIAEAVTNNVSASAVAPLLGVLAGITSLFSDSIGVVLPLYIPICAGTLASGVSATAVFSSAVIGGLSTGCAPFSTGGAMVLSFSPEQIRKKNVLDHARCGCA